MRRLSARVLPSAPVLHVVNWIFAVCVEAFEGMEARVTTKRGHLA